MEAGGDSDMHAARWLWFPVVQVQYFAVSIGRTWENLNSGGAVRCGGAAFSLALDWPVWIVLDFIITVFFIF